MITNLKAPIFNIIHDYFLENSECIVIISPFISNNTLKSLLEGIESDRVIIVTSWREDHLIAGVSSLDLYPICMNNGWELFINSSVHAKIYSNSFKSCYITSANCTDSALNRKDGNVECFFFCDKLSMEEQIEIQHLIHLSVHVDVTLYEQYCDWYNKNKNCSVEQFESIQIKHKVGSDALPLIYSPYCLWDMAISFDQLSDWDKDGVIHDLSIFLPQWDSNMDFEEFRQLIRINFRKNELISTICDHIQSDGCFFGDFKIYLRNLLDEKMLCNRDITRYTQAMYAWLVELYPESFEVFVPYRHSQVIRRID